MVVMYIAVLRAMLSCSHYGSRPKILNFRGALYLAGLPALDRKMNNFKALTTLSNRYFGMRHGHSLANQDGIVVSFPENGVNGFGLSESGRRRVNEAIDSTSLLDEDTIILCSDFRRARETADIVHGRLRSRSDVVIDVRLRERRFGDLELKKDDAYGQIWTLDGSDPGHHDYNVESACEVMDRTSALIAELEKQSNGVTYLLVSHGDALQILQAAFHRRSAAYHRELPHLETAEIRRLNL